MGDQKLGGPGRVRTDDLFHAMEARSQLRHRPTRDERVKTSSSHPNFRLLAIYSQTLGVSDTIYLETF